MPIQSVEDDAIVEMEAVPGYILSSMPATNGIYREKALQTEEANGRRWNMVARKLYFNFFPMDIKNAPGEKPYSFNCVSRREISDFDITGGVVWAKVSAAGTDTARSSKNPQ